MMLDVLHIIHSPPDRPIACAANAAVGKSQFLHTRRNQGITDMAIFGGGYTIELLRQIHQANT